jgi:hypothetical protein
MSTSGNSASSRRQFLGATSLVGASLAAVDLLSKGGTGREQATDSKLENGYKYRIAFGCWINDMRSQALPLQRWPAPHLDEITVSSIIAAMDVQSRAGFNYLDAWGLFATYGYPPDIASVCRRGPLSPGEAIDPGSQAARHHLPVRHGALQLGLRSDHPGRPCGPRQEQGRATA